MDARDSGRERGQDDFERLQFRRTDALQFKLQRDINIRDDEICRLKTDLALIRGKADPFKQSDESLEKHRMELDRKVFEAKSQFERRRSRIESEHQQALQALELRHSAETQKLEKRLRSVLFESNLLKPIDAIDAFLSSMRIPKPKVDSAAKKKRRDAIRSEITEIEGKTRASNSRLNDLKAQLHDARKKLQALASSELIVPAVPPSIALVPEIARAREATDALIGKLDQEKQAAVDRCRAAERDISAMRNQLSALTKAQTEAEAALVELQRRKELRDKMTQFNAPLSAGSPRPVVLSAAERGVRIRNLLQEEKRLKKEIARLDFMVYGRAGKYQEWRHSS
jgi:chromosome segregation ATPase